MRVLISTSLIVLFFISVGHGSNSEVIMDGHGHIESYIYANQDENYFIDTELQVSIETFRYKRFFFNLDLVKETHMGRKYSSNMVFDPTRAHWSFGMFGRLEYTNYFFDLQIHHDCFHDIDRFRDNSVYWNSPRIGFGTMGYLEKNWYHKQKEKTSEIVWKNKTDYYVLAGFYAPRGLSFQKHHDYEFTLHTNLKYQVLQYKRLGIDLFLYNFWVSNNNDDFESQNRIDLNFTIYGNRGMMAVFIRHWFHDNQSIRNHKYHEWATGLHFGF